jgi:hypothetical protein
LIGGFNLAKAVCGLVSGFGENDLAPCRIFPVPLYVDVQTQRQLLETGAKRGLCETWRGRDENLFGEYPHFWVARELRLVFETQFHEKYLR